MKILYVHGLSSSGSTRTVFTLRSLLVNDHVVAPDLPMNPVEALQLLQRCVKEEKIDLVVGTSMGGMFTQKLRGTTKIIVNPAFHVSELMRTQLGVHEFFNPRQDGVQQFEITEALCDQYEQLEAPQFEGIDEAERAITYGLFGTEDELVNCQEEYKAHYDHFMTFKGEHRLNEGVIKAYLVPLLEEIRKRLS